MKSSLDSATVYKACSVVTCSSSAAKIGRILAVRGVCVDIPNRGHRGLCAIGEQYGIPSAEEGFHEFEGWIHHLRNSEPLELGRVRGSSSYGAACQAEPSALPVIKWAQIGDWAGYARSWYWWRLSQTNK